MSGQPRFLERCYPYIHEFILKPNGMPDIFAHLWWSEETCDVPYKYGGDGGWKHQRISPTAPETFRKLYEPNGLCIEPVRNWTLLSACPSAMEGLRSQAASEEDPSCDRLVSNSVSMWNSIYKANLLRKEYEWANHLRYDWIIRIRTDLEIYTPVRCAELAAGTFYFSDIGQQEQFICDWLNVASGTQMDAACSLWYEFENLLETHYSAVTGEKFSNEHMLRHKLTDAGIPTQGVKWRVTLPRF
jgi:hypothetical protein